MKKMLSLVACIVLIVVLINACKKDSANNETVDCSTISTTFAVNVSPLISTSCAKSGCHATGSTNGPGALTNYTQIYNSRVAIRAAVSSGYMPEDATFSATQKATITCWIDAGAPQN
jgi:hypothetical protein